jgi:hypothetical protein
LSEEITEQHRELVAEARARIFALQDRLFQDVANGTFERFDFDANLQHVFAPGAYGRTLSFPRGAIIVGKIHKHAHLNVLSKGDVLVFTESGGLERLIGPKTMVSPPGTKRALLALEDTVWTTVHLTDETDLEKIEEHVIAKSYEEYDAFVALQSSQAPRAIEGEKL